MNIKNIQKRKTSIYILLAVLVLFYGCYTKVKLPEVNKISNNSIEHKVSNFIEWNNTIFKEEVIHLKDRYSFGEGILYEFNFNYNKNEWLGIKDEIIRFLINDYYVTEFWYRSGSSSCIDPRTKTAFFMIIKPRFIVKFSEQPEGISKYNYRPLKSPHINCGVVLFHYTIIDSLK